MSSRAKRIRLRSSRQLQKERIEQLCDEDEVLSAVSSYLSPKELKCATLVCKKWNEVIGSSAVAMKKFCLKINESELLGQQFRSARSYQHIELELTTGHGPPSDQKSLENLGRFFELSQVKYFKIFAYNQSTDREYAFAVCFNNPWNTFSIDAMKLAAVLKQMKLLQELVIECPKGFRGSFTSTMDLPKLTKLAVKSPDMSIFRWIFAINVTEIDLFHQSIDAVESVQQLASFLQLCKQITILKMNSSIIEDLFGNGKWKDFNLKLSDLHTDLIGIPDATILSEFLISQAPNLTSLRIEGVREKLSDSVRNSIGETLSHLTNLKVLDYNFGSDGGFLGQMPKLEQLTLYRINDINSIARFNRKLTYLKVEFLESSLDTWVMFSELKYLNLGLDPSSNCHKVIKSSPKVETIELRLNESEERYEEILSVVMQQPTLQHLKLHYLGDTGIIGHFKGVFGPIVSNNGGLKSLSLSKRVGPAWKSLEFFFPENRSEWNEVNKKLRVQLIEAFLHTKPLIVENRLEWNLNMQKLNEVLSND